MRNLLVSTAALAWLGLAGQASAATVSIEATPTSLGVFNDLATGTTGSFTDYGIMFSGGGVVRNGSLVSNYLEPAGDSSNYMAVPGGKTETLTYSKPQTKFSLLWGSIDGDVCGKSASCGNNNLLTFSDGYTLSGANLVSMMLSTGTGSKTLPTDNEYVTVNFNGLAPFTWVTLSTPKNAFEFDMAIPTIPEPSTWAMVILGFAGLGYGAFRGSRKQRRFAIEPF